ncbi:MAG: hypothetical protein ACW98Y_15800, partial [Candidatus Thorarchaeota archaeon]
MTRDDDEDLIGFEVTEIPKSYIEYDTTSEVSQLSSWNANKTNLQVQRFLRTALHAGIRIAFRIETSRGNRRLLYLLRRKDTKLFEPIYKAHFQNFNLQPVKKPWISTLEGPVHVCIITGAPKSSPQSLDTVSEIISTYSGQAFYQVYVIPAKPSSIKRTVAKYRLRKALEKSQKQQTNKGWLGQETLTRVDVDSVFDSEDYKQRYTRLSAERLLKCQVTLAFWGNYDAESSLRTAVNALLGSISTLKNKTRMKTKYLSGSLATDVLKKTLLLQRKRMTTAMTPNEAVPLFEIPHIEIGTQTTSHSAFSTAATSKASEFLFQNGKIVLGSVYRYTSLDENRIKYLD